MQDFQIPSDLSAAIADRASLFDVAGQAVIATTADGRIVYWNDSASLIYGWAKADVLGRDILNVTPANNSAEQGAGIMAQLRNGRTWSGEFCVRRRDGTEFLAKVRDIPVRNDVGELIGIVGVSEPANP